VVLRQSLPPSVSHCWPYLLGTGGGAHRPSLRYDQCRATGQVTAQVTDNVYDSPTGCILLIPQGTRLVGLNGKDDRLTRQDFIALARTIGLRVEDAEAGLDALATRVTARLLTLQLPPFAGEFDGAKTVRDKVEAIVAARCVSLSTKSRSE
jgi:hypothetical protein